VLVAVGLCPAHNCPLRTELSGLLTEQGSVRNSYSVGGSERNYGAMTLKYGNHKGNRKNAGGWGAGKI